MTDPFGFGVDVVAIIVSVVSLALSIWVAGRINREQLAASSQTSFAEATGDHYDRICDRFVAIQEEAAKVVALAVSIEKSQGVKTGGDLTDYVTQAKAAAVAAMQLSTELQVLQNNFQLHANIIGYEPDTSAAIARIKGLEQLAIKANADLSFPSALSMMSNQMIGGAGVWDNAWVNTTAKWATGALELQVKVVEARTAMNAEFLAFTAFASAKSKAKK